MYSTHRKGMSRQTTREMIAVPAAAEGARPIRASGISPGGAEVTRQMIAGELVGRNIWTCGASNSSMTVATPQPPATLEYGREASRRRKWFRAGVALVMLVLCGYATRTWGPSAWHRALLLRAQRICLTYRAAPEQIVYEEDPAR